MELRPLTAPAGFLYAVKGSRFITHNKKLREVETPLANFFASGVLRLEEMLGQVEALDDEVMKSS